MKLSHRLIAGLVASMGLMAAAPAMAQSAPERHKACHVDRHHHRTCHWVK
jgi:hypothetical protein